MSRDKRRGNAKFKRILRRAKIVADETPLQPLQPKDWLEIKGFLICNEPDKIDEINEDLPEIRAVLAEIRRREKKQRRKEGGKVYSGKYM